jgi:hypothetical protein
MTRLLLFTVALLFALPLASPHAAPTGDAAGSFTMQPVEGGMLKLDTRTGAMSFCRARGEGWICEAVPDDRAALEAEITRLHDRLATLERRGVPDIMAPPIVRPPVTPEARPTPDVPSKTPEQLRGEMDQAMDMAEAMFRRFLGMVDRLRGETQSEKL